MLAVILAREFEPSGHFIRAWVAQADRNEGRREEAVPGLTAAERGELTWLRHENKQLRVERLPKSSGMLTWRGLRLAAPVAAGFSSCSPWTMVGSSRELRLNPPTISR